MGDSVFFLARPANGEAVCRAPPSRLSGCYALSSVLWRRGSLEAAFILGNQKFGVPPFRVSAKGCANLSFQFAFLGEA